MEKTQIEELYSLPWEDKSCADPIEKARRVLGQIANRDSGYFYNDGYPRSVTIKKEVENVLKVLNTLAAAAPSDHTDDLAVDRFAAAMKAKMAASRAKGRNGWDNAHLCPVERLQGMLIDHLAKGDPVDIGNFAMMLWNRGEPVAAAAPGAELEPVAGDLLPPVGSKVLIHLGDQDEWVEHTVTGYYVWSALSHQIKEGERHAYRVFVRVVDANGYDNARLLADVRRAS